MRTDEFDEWLAQIKDKIGKARIIQRLDAAIAGNFGDCEPVGEGVPEMRIHVGPRYRVYYTRHGEVSTSCSQAAPSQRKNATSSAPSPWRAS